MQVVPWLLAGSLLALPAATAWALPIGFYMNQGAIEYDERKSEHFIVYHDRRAAEEGAAAVNALEAGRPHLERWLGVHRKTPLPVIMSAVTEGASFANFITDVLEVQSGGQPSRDLIWHEYTHSTMYRHYDNFLGPVGGILHLPWLPTWFIEGVAELTSASVGSDYTAGIERYQALSGKWPTFDSLHSLYRKATPVEHGYATSAALVRYVLRKSDPEKFPDFLNDLRWKSMPWWWPYSVVPYADSLPFDRALKKLVGMNSEELYEDYKRAAKDHWSKASNDRFLFGEEGHRRAFGSVRQLRSNGVFLSQVTVDDDEANEMEVVFNPTTGWATSLRKRDAQEGTAPLRGAVEFDREDQLPISKFAWRRAGEIKWRQQKREGYVTGMHESEKHLVWLEYDIDETRICTLKKPEVGKKLGKKAIRCEAPAVTPRSLSLLGGKPESTGEPFVSELWFAASDEKLSGTQYEIHTFNPDTRAKTKRFATQARPVAAAFAGKDGKDTWLLLAERDQRSLRLIDDAGQCVAMLTFKDHLVSAHGLADGSLVVGVYAGGDANLRRIKDPRTLARPCEPLTHHDSPLLFATRQSGDADLTTSLSGTDPWQPALPPTPEAEQRFAAMPSLDKDPQPGTGEGSAAKPAKWRGRPIFLVPWIGAEDALGSQLGILSVPLMDHLQNETVRVTLLYGFPSNFPYQEVSLTSTRYRPTLAATYYRQQTYNGRFIDPDDATGVVSSYLDEKGVRFESDLDTRLLGGTASLGTGLKVATLQPYIGPSINGEGTLVEPGASASLVHGVGRWTFSQSLSGRIAPEALNENFDYNQLGASTSVGVGLPLESRFTLGLEGSRTRGKKRRDFKEIYRPLKTFIPGSGGGYNQNSYPLAGEGNGLFQPVFADTQGRARANWTVPVVRDVDKVFWIIYAERLDFTAFYNYGAAWNGDEPRRGWDGLISAHGYNLDLQMESHGLRFNAGLGVGQVVGRDWESYMSLGFDAIL